MEVNLHRAKSRLNLGYVCYHLVYILALAARSEVFENMVMRRIFRTKMGLY